MALLRKTSKDEMRGSFDNVPRGEAARDFAQDDDSVVVEKQILRLRRRMTKFSGEG
jgi:hypothetical protein